jgi:hypothetical protein
MADLLLYVTALSYPGTAPAHEAVLGLPAEGTVPLSQAARVTMTREGETLLTLDIDPTTATVTLSAAPEVLHYYRYADATLKVLPAAPPPLGFARGDAYIALSPGVRAVVDSPALARFLHLRDYFNARRLAEVLLARLIPASAEAIPEDLTVLVVEAR